MPSCETPEDYELFHYGVKGMKWGVRKKASEYKERYSNIRNRPLETREMVTKTGLKITVKEDRTPAPAAAIIAASSKLQNKNRNYHSYTIRGEDGKRLGEAEFNMHDSGELNLGWLGVNPKSRGQGIASSVFDLGIEKGRELGAKKLTLEVPGNAPDAKHIYTKAGFKDDGPMDDYDPDDVWGGLTKMSMDIDSVKHSDASDIEEAILRLFEHKLQIARSVMSHSNSPEDYELFHYGVKGMKWGVRKDRGGGIRGAISRRKAKKEQEARNEERNRSADSREVEKIKKKKVSSLTNADLQKANKRMQLETEYARLMESTRTKGSIEKGWDFVMGVNNQGNQAIGAYNGPTGKLLRSVGSKVVNH